MRPTRLSTLATLLLVVAVPTWGVLALLDGSGSARLPLLPWTAPVLLAGLAVLVWLSAQAVHRRLTQRARPPNPLGVARLAVLGKASAASGAVVAGLYLGYAALLAESVGIPALRDRLVVALVSTLAALLLAAAGLVLEHRCRRRTPPQEGSPA